MESWNCYRLYVDRDEKKFFIYDPVVTDAPRQKQITIQDAKGEFVKLCEPSNLAQKGLPCPNNGFAIDDSNKRIFHVNAHEYKIYQYDETGRILNIITNKEELSECKSISDNFPVKRDFSDTYQQKFRSAFNWINVIYILDNRFLLVIYLTSIRPNPIKYQLDLLSLEGEFIKSNIKLPTAIRSVTEKYLFTIEKREMTVDGELTPVIVNIWELDLN